MLAVCTLLASTVPLDAANVPQAPVPPRPAPSAQPELPMTGSLLICGGGLLPDAVFRRFLDLAGGKKARLVVIPTASELGQRTGVWASFEMWKRQPAGSVALLHTLDRRKANDPAFIKPLTEATGVWISGGDQSRLTMAYSGTAVERELRRLLKRGGVIGGTSAGASVMSSLMIVSGNPDAKVGTGLGLLDEVVIDQHFHNRNRMKRLQGVIDRHPSYLGIGIDEGTAVLLEGRQVTVLGTATVSVFLPAAAKAPAVQLLKAGDKIELDPLCRFIRSRRK
jgi:cyanophycinase